MHVLIADDSSEHSAALLSALSRWFGPSTAGTALDADGFAAALEQGGYDLAITVSSIHWADTTACGEAVRARFPGLPIVMIVAAPAIPVGGASAGFDGLAVDPQARQDSFRDAVRAALDKVEQRATENEQRLRLAAVLNTVADAIITITETGIIESFNPAAERIFGYTAAEAIGRNISILMPAPFAADHGRYLAEYRRTGIGRIIGIGRELPGQRKSGEIFALELAISDTPLPNGRLFTGVCRDISERKRTEGALAKALGQALLAERAKADFLATMSHELRTPLNAIMGFTEALLMEVFGPVESPRQRTYLHDIHASATRLFETIGSTLDFIEANDHLRILVEKEFDLGALIRRASERHRAAAAAERKRLTLDIAEDLPPVRADEGALRQIVENLLDNAFKFARAVGSIALAARQRPDNAIEIRVSDDGIGMAPADHAVVTAPFGQLGRPYARRTQGIGLGLPLSKSLIELHGGTLTLDSTSGAGTTVIVTIPPSRVLASRRA
ncbi:MAG: PAS domain S-box protein [Azospirillum sp.]|nr:PAS domain S-box protein [Azospirillum sp.]